MRAGGREAGRARGGIRSPRGPFLRLWASMRADPLPRSGGGSYAKVSSLLGGFLCAAPSALWGRMNGYELAFALTSL